MNKQSFWNILILLNITLLFAISCNLESPEQPAPPTIDPVGEATGTIVLVEDEFEGTPLVVVGSEELNFVVSFENPNNEVFTAVQDKIPVIFKGEDDTEYDIFGFAISGPKSGDRLATTNSLMGYWMTFGAFYPGTEIFEGVEPDPGAQIEVSTNTEWAIPNTRVFDGGPGKDGIPALEGLDFANAENIAYLQPWDLVVGFKAGEDVRAYPHKILDWHEIANDLVNNDVGVAITYCPLTGTAVGWNRTLDGDMTTFGVSGLLYNTNLMPYDRATDSYWSQMRLDCVNGSRLGTEAEVMMVVETTWQTWVNMYPNSQVLTTNTGHNRNYLQYPYGDYRTNDDNLIFPLEYDDDRLGRKDRVHGVIINDKAKVYPLELFK